MKTKKISRKEAQQTIEKFFEKDSFTSEELKKIKKIAMSQRIKLTDYRKMFCQKCLSQLKGRIRVTGTHKTVECESCGYKNKVRI
jgi:RNase P subunit RPR2